jgi:hypothetical protein
MRVKIVISQFGDVDAEEASSIIQIIEECYDRLEPHDVLLLDLYLFERSSSLDAFMLEEYSKMGRSSSYMGQSFFAMHDAWHGTSRIFICLERMRNLPKLVREGGIQHEVGHSVLHGSLKHYLLPVPLPFIELKESFNLPEKYILDLFYLLSIAVKDYEVTRLLYRKGYVDCQAHYTKYLLKPSEEEIAAWGLARGEPLKEILCLMSCMKNIACAAPLLRDEKYGGEIHSRMLDYIGHISEDFQGHVLSLLGDIYSLDEDTENNINRFANAVAKKFVERILKGR